MYITPNSTIKTLNNINIDSDYQNTLYFTDKSAQYTYFNNNAKYSFPAQTYQRVNKNVVRVNRKADDLYDCSYMMFQNTAYGNKWFYAFIDSIEYVNDITSNIYYHIDVIQTWLKDWMNVGCFVEREHVLNDAIGANIIPESVEVGEYVFNGNYDPIDVGETELPQISDMAFLMAVCDIEAAADGNIYDGVFSGAKLLTYSCTDEGVNKINARISTDFMTKPDAIISIYMVPAFLLGSYTDDGELEPGASGASLRITASPITINDTLNGYKPRNHKLYTYPYNFYHVDNASGGELTTRYEFFENLTPSFEVFGGVTQPVKLVLHPYNYKGSPHYGDGLSQLKSLNTETLVLEGYPLCSWNMDSWKAWQAQNSVPLVTDTLSKVASIAMAGTTGISGGSMAEVLGINVSALHRATENKNSDINTGALVGGIASLSLASSLVSKFYMASIQADICRGSFNGGNVNVSKNKQTFFGGRMSVNAQMAHIIDEYFDRFGYAINRVKTPNYTGRPYWNYVKTAGCIIRGNIPSDDKKQICRIFDNGITFWHDPAHIGDYYLDNSPVPSPSNMPIV